MSQFEADSVDFDAPDACSLGQTDHSMDNDSDAHSTARASGEAPEPEPQPSPSPPPSRRMWHPNQDRTSGRCQATSLQDRYRGTVDADNTPATDAAKAHVKGHFSIGTLNKGDLKNFRDLINEDALYSPTMVTFIQDPMHHLQHFHDSARACGVMSLRSRLRRHGQILCCD